LAANTGGPASGESCRDCFGSEMYSDNPHQYRDTESIAGGRNALLRSDRNCGNQRPFNARHSFLVERAIGILAGPSRTSSAWRNVTFDICLHASLNIRRGGRMYG